MKFINRYWKQILVALGIFFLIGSLILVFVFGGDPASTFNHNIAVEFFIGGLMLIIPIMITIWVGKKISKNLFYNDIENFITRIKEQRELSNITNEGARNLVKEASIIFGREVLEDPLLKSLPKRVGPITYDKKDCGVCGLKAQIAINNHCKNCKLDCFAWEKFIQ